ncbi:MAG: 2-isopropylmalate synthase [Calditrichaeota bacterium]|nr:2-isopropylmalate synthase [Calditrichota bacterium]
MELREPLNELIHEPTEFTGRLNFPDPSRIRVYDSTLRDGEQMPGVAFSPGQKYEIAKALSEMGVHIFDLGFPFAALSDRHALQLIVQGRRRGDIREDVEFLVMCRSTQSDVDITIETLEAIGVDISEVTFFIFTSGSDLHLKYKIGRALLKREGRDLSEWLDLPVQFYRDANLRMMCDTISYARERGVREVEFGGEDGSRADLDYTIALAKAGYEAGGTRYSFPDTVGCFTPEGVDHYIPRIVEEFPGRDLVVHFHNDFGLAGVNTVRAMSHGINIPTCTVNGLGERAGNAPLHQVVMLLKVLYGVDIPGFRYDHLIKLRRMLEQFSGIPVGAHEPIIGEGVFTHESGIHTAGILIHPAIYQVIPPELLDRKIHYVFGKHTGIAAVRDVLYRPEYRSGLERDGVEVNEDLVGAVMHFVKDARQKRTRSDSFVNVTEAYYNEYHRLGISELRLVELASTIGRLLQEGLFKPKPVEAAANTVKETQRG